MSFEARSLQRVEPGYEAVARGTILPDEGSAMASEVAADPRAILEATTAVEKSRTSRSGAWLRVPDRGHADALLGSASPLVGGPSGRSRAWGLVAGTPWVGHT